MRADLGQVLDADEVLAELHESGSMAFARLNGVASILAPQLRITAKNGFRLFGVQGSDGEHRAVQFTLEYSPTVAIATLNGTR